MTTLEFGLDTFGDVTTGKDGAPLSHAEVIRNVIAEAELADSVGVDVFGVGEHHRPDFAISAPEVLLAAIAARTVSALVRVTRQSQLWFRTAVDRAKRVRTKLLVVGVAACVAVPAAAQSQRDSVVGEVLTNFRPGRRIQVGLLRSRWTGRYERVGGDTLFFASPGQPPMAIRFNAIDTLWRQADHLRRGAWIGGTTLGLLGFATVVIGKLAGEAPSSNEVRAEDVGVGLAWGAGLGVVGALTGGWIGSGFKRWVVVYPR